MKQYSYYLAGPEGYHVHPEPFDSVEAVARAAAMFMTRCIPKGYYLDSDRVRQPLDWVAENMQVSFADRLMTPLEAYAKYVSAHVQEVGQSRALQQVMPMPYDEFIASPECQKMMEEGYAEEDDDAPEQGTTIGEAVYVHEATTKIFYCKVRGLAPVPDAIGFDNFDEILSAPYGKSVNHMIAAGELTEVALADLETQPDRRAAMTSTPEEKLEFLKSKGLTVGLMKTSDKEEPYLVYAIKPDSELCVLRSVNRLVDAEIARDRALADLVEYR